MKRTPLRQRRGELKRKTALRASRPSIVWLAARDRALDRVEVHHIVRRSQGGTDELANLLVTCSLHHRYIHEHPAESYERGWLKRGAA